MFPKEWRVWVIRDAGIHFDASPQSAGEPLRPARPVPRSVVHDLWPRVSHCAPVACVGVNNVHVGRDYASPGVVTSRARLVSTVCARPGVCPPRVPRSILSCRGVCARGGRLLENAAERAFRALVRGVVVLFRVGPFLFSASLLPASVTSEQRNSGEDFWNSLLACSFCSSPRALFGNCSIASTFCERTLESVLWISDRL